MTLEQLVDLFQRLARIAEHHEWAAIESIPEPVAELLDELGAQQAELN